MNAELVEKVVNAVLYEGHILYPYRPSARKNQQRFTFGRVYPAAYSEAQGGAEPGAMQAECLLRGGGGDPEMAWEVSVRFLHPTSREVCALPAPATEMPAENELPVVPELCVDGKLYQTWQEAVERGFSAPAQRLRALTERFAFDFPAAVTREPIRDGAGRVVGLIRRRQQALAGVVEIAAEPVDARVFKLTVRVLNQTPVADPDLGNQEAVLLRTFASTHAVLRAHGGGEFLSLTDPPAEYAEAAAACKNIGVWPVLVGEEEKGERDAMLASPIILYDYPKIAPESAGNLFDGGEIDEILTLRIMTLTDEEKGEMRQVDDFARQILERTDALPAESLLAMHGAMRETIAPAASVAAMTELEHFLNPNTRLGHVTVAGVDLKTGDRVRIRPQGRADVMDLALAGKIAIIEAIEQDAEENVHLALVIEDDPGRDLGMLRQPGHRFFYTLAEVEPV